MRSVLMQRALSQFSLKTAANMSGSIAAGVSLVILFPPCLTICQIGDQHVSLQCVGQAVSRVLPTNASAATLVEKRAARTARLHGCEYARSRHRLNWWRELTPGPPAQSYRLS